MQGNQQILAVFDLLEKKVCIKLQRAAMTPPCFLANARAMTDLCAKNTRISQELLPTSTTFLVRIELI